MITTLIKALLAAATAYFNSNAALAELSSKRLVYDLITQSENRQLALRAQIERLRQLGTEEATQNADLLFKELQKEKDYETYLTTRA